MVRIDPFPVLTLQRSFLKGTNSAEIDRNNKEIVPRRDDLRIPNQFPDFTAAVYAISHTMAISVPKMVARAMNRA